MFDPLDDLFRTQPGQSRIFVWLSSIEVVLGAVMLCVTVVFVIGIFGFVTFASEWMETIPRWPTAARIGIPIAWLLALVFGLRSIAGFAGSAGRQSEHPLVLTFALNRVPSRRIGVRVSVACWWALLGVTVMAVGAAYTELLRSEHGTPTTDAIEFTFHAVVHIGSSFTLNGCLLIALFHLTRSERLTRAAAAVRLVVDLVVVCVLMYTNEAGYGIP